MMRKPPKDNPTPSEAEIRETRLKAALKANMAKRKAQARAKAQSHSADAENRTSDKG